MNRLLLGLSLPLFSMTGWGEQVDLVEQGKQAFSTWGCAECHVSAKDDPSIKTGPSLYGLFLTEPRGREVLVAASGERVVVRADRDYFTKSVRNSQESLAIAEVGATKGEAYPAIMPAFAAAVVSDGDLESIWHYLRHAADEPQAGPAVVMVEKQAAAKSDNPLDDLTEVVVGQRPRVFRAPVLHSSGRAIHVGLPEGVNFTFDPRQFSVRSVWSGGFLNLAKEQKGRSTPGSDHGQNSHELLDATPMLTPLTADGRLIDFEFKEPDVADDEAVIKHLWKGGDFLKELAGWDSEFLGYSEQGNQPPEFHFRVGKNRINQRISYGADGVLMVAISGDFETSQSFQLPRMA